MANIRGLDELGGSGSESEDHDDVNDYYAGGEKRCAGEEGLGCPPRRAPLRLGAWPCGLCARARGERETRATSRARHPPETTDSARPPPVPTSAHPNPKTHSGQLIRGQPNEVR